MVEWSRVMVLRTGNLNRQDLLGSRSCFWELSGLVHEHSIGYFGDTFLILWQEYNGHFRCHSLFIALAGGLGPEELCETGQPLLHLLTVVWRESWTLRKFIHGLTSNQWFCLAHCYNSTNWICWVETMDYENVKRISQSRESYMEVIETS